jgi:hypothetical protein
MFDQPSQPKLRHQDRILAANLTALRADWEALGCAPQAQAALTQAGWDAGQLAQGLTLCRLALAAFANREWARCRLQRAQQDLEAAQVEARQVHLEFYLLARYLFDSHVARRALRVYQPPPTELEKFHATARAGYRAALANPEFRRRLNRYGSLSTARATLEALGHAQQAVGAAQAALAQAEERLRFALEQLRAACASYQAALEAADEAELGLVRQLLPR